MGRASPAGPLGSEVSASSPTANEVDSSGLSDLPLAPSAVSLPAGEMAKIFSAPLLGRVNKIVFPSGDQLWK